MKHTPPTAWPCDDLDEQDWYSREPRLAADHLITMAPAYLARIEREWEAAAVDPRERIV
jgi:hypothetical protein